MPKERLPEKYTIGVPDQSNPSRMGLGEYLPLLEGQKPWGEHASAGPEPYKALKDNQWLKGSGNQLALTAILAMLMLIEQTKWTPAL